MTREAALGTVLTAPVEIVGIALAVLALRGSLAGFLSLGAGKTASEVADDMAVATAASFPSAAVVALCATLYLVLS